MRKSRRLRHSNHPIHVDAPPPSDSEFALSLTRTAVAQICQSRGFKRAQNLAHRLLTDIAIRYMKSIARSAAASANRHGRTESNLVDVIFALEDLASVQGFSGNGNSTSRSLYSSGVVRDLMRFVKYAREVPFAQALPRRRIFNSGANGNMLEVKEFVNYSGHVPRWLPAMPVLEEVKEVEKEKEPRWGCFGEVGNKCGVEVEEEKNCGVKVEREGNSGGNIEVLGEREKVRFKIGGGNREFGEKWREWGL